MGVAAVGRKMPVIVPRRISDTNCGARPGRTRGRVEKVAALNFQRGLEVLAQKYRARLAAEGTLDQTTDTVMAELNKLREEIAANDYRR